MPRVLQLLLSTHAPRRGAPHDRRSNITRETYALLAALLIAFPVCRAFAQGIARDSTLPRQAGNSIGNTIGWIDAGAARTRQLVRKPIISPFVGAGVRRATTRSVLHLDAAALVGDDTASAGQLLGAVALSPFSSGRFVTEMNGSLAAFRLDDSKGEGNRAFLVRQQLRHTANAVALGVSIDAGAGLTRREHPDDVGRFESFPVTSHGISVWMSKRNTTVSTRWQRIRTNDFPLVEAAGYILARNASAYDFDHLTASAQHQRDRVSLQATLERQQGRSATVGHTTAFAASAALDIARGLTLSVGAGKQLADPLHGLPKAHYSSLSLRYTMSRAPRPVSSAPLDREAWLELLPVTGGVVTVQVRAPLDATVEVATSHGEWMPTTMERMGASFVARIPLPSGTHRIAVRVNKGEWRAPRGLARVVDDLGGAAGLVIVP